MRIGIGLVIAAILAVVAVAAANALGRVSVEFGQVGELLQGIDAGANDVILLCVALFFLCSVEARVKRNRTLTALHELRSIAHVIDMHQLSKDPEAILSPTMATASSPHRNMTRFELARYLDYCSEMLSLSSKLAALHIQYVRDPVVIAAVNDVETLTSGLAQKIWQKIIILDSETARSADQAGGSGDPRRSEGVREKT